MYLCVGCLYICMLDTCVSGSCISLCTQVSKPSVSVPISEVNSYKQLPFTVHVDDDNDQVMR